MNVLHPIIIVGAGPAGIGTGALLELCETPALILEKGRIGESFRQWPKETRFISPSFTGNFFNAPDLNTITPDSSPAFSLQTEHPTGEQYAEYLEDVADSYNLNIQTGITVERITQEADDTLTLKTSDGTLRCASLIWAGGESQFPSTMPHTQRPQGNYTDLPKGHHMIIGGSESGIDAAFHLTKNGSSISIFDADAPWEKRVSDSSYGLSPYTVDRLRTLQKNDNVSFFKEDVQSVTPQTLTTAKRAVELDHPPLNATGFDITQSLAGELFHFKEGFPELTEKDESTKLKNVYLVGPHVKHDDALFCFIYKYRQRFAVVVREILRRAGQENPAIQYYADRGFLLDDLSCCDGECEC